DHARAARRERRCGHVGLDRRLREHHRGELGGARRLAGGRHAAAPRRALAPTGDRRRLVIPLSQPVIGDGGEQVVLETLRSGRLSLGPMLPRFEESFAAKVGVEHASAVSSGTAGLHLALRAAGVAEGDEVITTPFSFVASANSILYERATPVFCDI